MSVINNIKAKLKVLIKKRKRIFAREPKMKFAYGWYYKHSRVKDNIILFESFHGKTISDSPLAMLQALVEKFPADQYEIYYATNKGSLKDHSAFIEKNNLPVSLVSITDYKYAKVLATARYLINNSSFPAYFIKKDEQTYLQTWHGTPLKTLGKEMRKGIESMYNVQHNFLQADYIMFPNAFTKDVIMRDYNLDNLYTGKVVMCGYPRNSVLLDQEKAAAVRKKYGLEGKTVYAYMPTWRGTSNHSIQVKGYSDEVDHMMEYLDRCLTDDQILFVNFHPLLGHLIKLNNYKHIRKFPPDVGNYDFLACTDALVTDYSSVFFDYSITHKPILLYMYDYDQYMKDRGMYMDVKSLPFVQLSELEELGKMLSSEEILKADYSDSDYAKTFTKYDAPDCPEKLLHQVLSGESDLELIDYAANKKIKHRVLHINNLKGGGDFVRLARYAKKNDIVLFERKDFNISRSSELYDTCNNQFDYVFMSRTTPRTYLEEILSIAGHKKTISALDKRELKRTFPNLTIQMPYRESFYVAETGCSLRGVVRRPVRADVTSDGDVLRITIPDAEKIQLKKLLIVGANTEILYTCDCTDSSESVISLNRSFFEMLLPMLALNKSHLIEGEFVDKKSGKRFIGSLINPRLNDVAYEKIVNNGLITDFQKPIPVDPDIPTAEGEQEDSLVIVPIHYPGNRKNGLRFELRKTETSIHAHFRPLVESYKSGGKKAVIRLKIPAINELDITDVILKYRSAVQIRHSLPYEIRKTGKFYYLTVNIDFTAYEFREIYWDLCVCVKWYGMCIDSHVHFPNRKYKFLFYLANRQYDMENGMLLYPYYTKGSNLSFLYKTATPYDGRGTAIKEIAAFICYLLFGGLISRKPIWIVYEKFCSMAQDNGYYFFRHCMEALSEQEKRNIYYIIDKNAPDYQKVAKYGRNVIPFMSFRHMLYCLAARIYVASDSRTHAYLWRGKPGILKNRIYRKPIFFLQHGVTALKIDDQLFGKKGTSPMTFFATTSEFEQKIVVDHFGYDESEAPITGFARWDVLEDHSSNDHKTILIMPTWRSWLEEVSNDVFLESDYYRRYASLVNSAALADMLEKYQVKVIFYIHPKFADYIGNFASGSEHVQIIPFGQEPLNEIMMRSQAMITDYSSVCWDMYYQKKPVIFYQFDVEQYNEVHGSYIDLETELFGVRALDEKMLLEELERCIRSGFALSEKDLADHSHYFAYVDDKNSRRTYDFIMAAQENELI